MHIQPHPSSLHPSSSPGGIFWQAGVSRGGCSSGKGLGEGTMCLAD